MDSSLDGPRAGWRTQSLRRCLPRKLVRRAALSVLVEHAYLCELARACGNVKFAWSWLDTESSLQLVAARKDIRLQGGLGFGTTEASYLLEILQEYEVNELNYGTRSLVPP